MKTLPITLCVTTHNSADRLEGMLKRHKGVVAEILVAVQTSTDNTYEIAEKYADMVFKRTCKGAADPDRNWLFSIASQPWVLYLDDDEYIEKDLIGVLPELVTAPVDVYWLKTKNLVDGQNIHDILGDDPHPRLFKKNMVKYKDQVTNLDHTYPECSSVAKTAYLNYEIVHDRTLEKIVASNRARNKIATKEQVQMQEQFISSVKQLLDNKKDD